MCIRDRCRHVRRAWTSVRKDEYSLPAVGHAERLATSSRLRERCVETIAAWLHPAVRFHALRCIVGGRLGRLWLYSCQTVCKRWHFASWKVTFYSMKGYLLRYKRQPFTKWLLFFLFFMWHCKCSWYCIASYYNNVIMTLIKPLIVNNC